MLIAGEVNCTPKQSVFRVFLDCRVNVLFSHSALRFTTGVWRTLQ